MLGCAWSTRGDDPGDQRQQCGRWWYVVPMASTREGGVRLGHHPMGDRWTEPRWYPQAQDPDDKWVLVPLGHWNWKWNQARGNYSTYEQELLAGVLVLSSQARLLKRNPVVWLCDQEPVGTFWKGAPPEKAKLRRWWTYLSQLRLTVHHMQGVKNECADYISRNNFDDLIGARSEVLAKGAFCRMDVHLDLNMTVFRSLDGLQQAEYLK